jgi:dihydroneopterin aldolase
MDKVLLQGLVFFGRHGCHAAERELGQKFTVDIEMSADLSLPCSTDRMEDTIDYVAVYNATRDIIEGPGAILLESLASRIADFCLQDKRVLDCRVRIRKPHVAVPGALDYLGIEITRHNKEEV